MTHIGAISRQDNLIASDPGRNERADLAVARPPSTKSWRSVLPIHPAAELFPLMSADELQTHSADIKKNGLQTAITVTCERVGGEWSYQLLDGRNRLDGIELAGFNPIASSRSRGRALRHRKGMECGLDLFLGLPRELGPLTGAINFIPPPDDPYAYVISANIRRRHLNVEQRQHLLIELIARSPGKSDRQIAKEIGVEHKTVGRARAKGEDVGRIPHVEMRTDAKGRKQPATKLLRSKKTPPATGQIPHARGIPNGKAQKLTRDDVLAWFGTASAAEHQRLFDSLGARVVVAAIPPDWLPLIWNTATIEQRTTFLARITVCELLKALSRAQRLELEARIDGLRAAQAKTATAIAHH